MSRRPSVRGQRRTGQQIVRGLRTVDAIQAGDERDDRERVHHSRADDAMWWLSARLDPNAGLSGTRDHPLGFSGTRRSARRIGFSGTRRRATRTALSGTPGGRATVGQ